MDKTQRKIPAIRIFRRIIQIVAFVFLPGLFIMAFSALKDVCTALVSGTFNFGDLSDQLWILIATIPITILMGRFFCGYLCAFGSMGDFIWFLSRKLRKKSSAIGEKADKILKSLKYILLVLIVVFVWILGIAQIDSTASPWTIFGMYVSLNGWPAADYLLTVGALFLLLILIGSFFVERFFCRYLCPLGAFYAVISRLRLFKIDKPRTQCGKCRVCTNSCPMGIPLYKYDVNRSGECINCFACTERCPHGNASANLKQPVAASMAVLSIAGLYYVGRLSTQVDSVGMPPEISAVTDGTSAQYADGVYTGSASGYRGMTEVQVTVSNGMITEITVTSTGDDSEYFSRAENAVINSILLSQTTDVDAVSGATFSSNAIMNAVKDALSLTTSADTAEASAEPATSSDGQSETSDAADSSSNVTGNANSSTVELTDGIYTGTGTGYRGETVVSVTVSDGVITEIDVVSYDDDMEYFERADETTISRIIEAQDVNVDTVSGATFSSAGIMEAVDDALGLDYDGTGTSGSNSGRRHQGG